MQLIARCFFYFMLSSCVKNASCGMESKSVCPCTWGQNYQPPGNILKACLLIGFRQTFFFLIQIKHAKVRIQNFEPLLNLLSKKSKGQFQGTIYPPMILTGFILSGDFNPTDLILSPNATIMLFLRGLYSPVAFSVGIDYPMIQCLDNVALHHPQTFF